MNHNSEWKIQRKLYLINKCLVGGRMALVMAVCYTALFVTLLCMGVALISLLAMLVFAGYLFLFLYASLFCMTFAYVSAYLYDQAQAAKSDYSCLAYVPPYSLEEVPAEKLLIHSIEDPAHLRETLLRSNVSLDFVPFEQLLRCPHSK